MQEPRFPIAVCGLVQIHEVHVDRRPREITIELRVQMQHGLSQWRNPPIHIFAGENVCIHSTTPTHRGSPLASLHTLRISSGPVKTGFITNLIGDATRAIDARQPACAEFCGHLPQCFGSVQMLAAGQEPKLMSSIRVQCHSKSSAIVSVACEERLRPLAASGVARFVADRQQIFHDVREIGPVAGNAERVVNLAIKTKKPLVYLGVAGIRTEDPGLHAAHCRDGGCKVGVSAAILAGDDGGGDRRTRAAGLQDSSQSLSAD